MKPKVLSARPDAAGATVNGSAKSCQQTQSRCERLARNRRAPTRNCVQPMKSCNRSMRKYRSTSEELENQQKKSCNRSMK